MPRATYLYRLQVTYPEGTDWPWEPEGWSEFAAERGLVDEDGGAVGFYWPAERTYLSRSGAEARAEAFRRWGATVEVQRSKPVEWPQPEGVTP